ncbi:MAG: hypothetical protein FJX00_01410 [Alphaproteobacteria bacterium]|nr:hypothetical protein [Alphaproteobacteria bacterium]
MLNQIPKDAVIQEIQFLVSQILHDFISHFTAISTGLDMPLHMAKEIFPMLLHSRQQLNAYLNIMRYLFSQGNGSDHSGTDMITAYGASLGITVTGHGEHHNKIITGWAIKQVQARSQARISRTNNTIHIDSPCLKPHLCDVTVLLGQTNIKSPRDSLSAYLARLLAQSELSLTTHSPSGQELIIQLHPAAQTSAPVDPAAFPMVSYPS